MLERKEITDECKWRQIDFLEEMKVLENKECEITGGWKSGGQIGGEDTGERRKKGWD